MLRRVAEWGAVEVVTPGSLNLALACWSPAENEVIPVFRFLFRPNTDHGLFSETERQPACFVKGLHRE